MNGDGLVCHVPELLVHKGWDTKTFAAYCVLGGVGSDIAYRLARGETNFTTATLAKVARVLGVQSISVIIDLENPEGRQ